MTTLEPTIEAVYIGIDVAKDNLQIDLQGKPTSLPNTAAGHKTLLGLLPAGAFLVMESTGCYHIAPLDFFQAAGIPVAIINPVRMKNFGKARGTLAKTDPIDAVLITAFGVAFKPRATPPRDAERALLSELVDMREKLGAQLVSWNNSLESQQSAAIKNLTKKQIRRDTKMLAEVEAHIAKLIASSKTLAPIAKVLQTCKGIGVVTSAVLTAQMPELGLINRHEAAALAGLAPYADDSGNHKGKRRVKGGRPCLKRALYLASLSAVRFHPTLSPAYKAMRAAGKPAKVALIATARKLVIILNAKLKEYYASLPLPA